MSFHRNFENKARWNLLGFFCLSFLNTELIFLDAQTIAAIQSTDRGFEPKTRAEKPQLCTVLELILPGRLPGFNSLTGKIYRGHYLNKLLRWPADYRGALY